MGRKIFAPDAVLIFKMFLVWTMPILKPFIRIKFIQDDVHNFFVNLMRQSLKYREENKVQREDFLDHLIQLRNKKGISGKLILTVES
jgi:cytochrome P450 family 6